MKLEALTCNQCGAPLEAPAHLEYVSCRHCGARLRVHRTADALFTEVLGQIERRAEQWGQELSAVRRRERLEEMDPQWARGQVEEIRRARRRARQGLTPLEMGVIGFEALFAGGFLFFAHRSGAPPWFLGWGAFVVAGGLVGLFFYIRDAVEREAAVAEFEARRAELLRQREETSVERSGGAEP